MVTTVRCYWKWYHEYHILFLLFCASQFGILTVEESRLDRKRAENDDHQSVNVHVKGPNCFRTLHSHSFPEVPCQIHFFAGSFEVILTANFAHQWRWTDFDWARYKDNLKYNMLQHSFDYFTNTTLFIRRTGTVTSSEQ